MAKDKENFSENRKSLSKNSKSSNDDYERYLQSIGV